MKLRITLNIFLVLCLFAPMLWQPVSPARAAAFEIPDTPAGQQLHWVLEQINTGGSGIDIDSLQTHFDPGFLAALPTDQLSSVFVNYVSPDAPFAVARVEGGITESRANVLLQGRTYLWRLTLGVTPTEPNQIIDLFFEPVSVVRTGTPDYDNWSDLKNDFEKLAPRTSFIAAEVTNGECIPVARVHPEESLAIASLFKLYVLGELADQVALGSASWEELWAINPNLISQPNGDMRYQPVGAEFPLWYYADQMISQSDNTATDHLIGRLGRSNVQDSFVRMGNASASRNQPLMLTREWFALRMRFSDEQLADFAVADDTSQLAILKEADSVTDTIQETEPWPGLRAVDTVEWFASAGDLCRALAWLQATGDPEVTNALSIQPGIVFDPNTWTYVGFKQGYETGVDGYAWLLQRNDGRWFVVAGIANDLTADINGAEFSRLMIAAVNLLAMS